MSKIQIKNKENVILFEFEKEVNTIKDTLIEGIKQGIDFKNANLSDANLKGACLIDADLSGADLGCADLKGADLRCVDLRCANLSGANFSGADLRCVDLRGAYLTDANFRDANLKGVDLRVANLRGANLRCADLRGANLRGACLIDADLRCADLRGACLMDANFSSACLIDADLRCAKSVPYIPFACPSDGEFIGWKKVNSCLIKLKIPFDAKRNSATSQKCRCDKAMVLEIIDLLNNEPIGEVLNISQKVPLLYRVGEIVYPDSFDENRWNECSNGIHFFINKEEAIRY